MLNSANVCSPQGPPRPAPPSAGLLRFNLLRRLQRVGGTVAAKLSANAEPCDRAAGLAWLVGWGGGAGDGQVFTGRGTC